MVQCYLPDVPVRLCIEGDPDFPARAIQLKPEDVLGKHSYRKVMSGFTVVKRWRSHSCT